MYGYTKEKATESVNKMIENYRRCINVIEALKPIAKQFDGKVINKKLESAFRGATGCTIKVEQDSRLDIKLYPHYSYQSAEKVTAPAYFDNAGQSYYQLTLTAYIDGVFSYYDYNREHYQIVTERTDSGKNRLKADALITEFEKVQDYYKNEIDKESEALDRVDEYAAKVAEIERLEKELRDVPYIVRRFFDLGIYVRHE